jgi:hypothetical protein
MGLSLGVLIALGAVVILCAIAARFAAARRLNKHLDLMQATEAAKAIERKQSRSNSGA